MLIYLVRHALADYTTGLPYHTVPGPGLSETGYAEAAEVARLLAPCAIERVVSSPLRRCLQTAEPLCAAIGLEPLIDDDIGEMATGEATTAMGLRMLRAVLWHSDAHVIALFSHAAPLEQLILALTHDRAVLPRPGDRGARIGTGHVWQVLRTAEGWQASHLDPVGVRA